MSYINRSRFTKERRRPILIGTREFYDSFEDLWVPLELAIVLSEEESGEPVDADEPASPAELVNPGVYVVHPPPPQLEVSALYDYNRLGWLVVEYHEVFGWHELGRTQSLTSKSLLTPEDANKACSDIRAKGRAGIAVCRFNLKEQF